MEIKANMSHISLYLHLYDRGTKSGVSGVITWWTIARSIENISKYIAQQSVMSAA